MTVAELIDHLKTFDPNLTVAYRCMSEQVMVEADELVVKELTVPRNDGWIQDLRSDLPKQTYLLFPGN